MTFKPGQYRGKIQTYGVSETQAGKPQIFVTFDVFILPEGVSVEQFDEVTESGMDDQAVRPVEEAPLTWFGSLVEGDARRITTETLVKMGLQGNWIDMVDGPSSGCLTVGKVLGMSIKENTYEGKTTMRIGAVYVPGEGFGVRALSRADLLKKIGGDGSYASVTGDIEARRQAVSAKGAGPVNSAVPASTTQAAPAAGKTAAKGKPANF